MLLMLLQVVSHKIILLLHVMSHVRQDVHESNTVNTSCLTSRLCLKLRVITLWMLLPVMSRVRQDVPESNTFNTSILTYVKMQLCEQ